ncbi:MAG: ParB/RepB/Spo0J family partition protein [Clostridiaceae bacterium]|jgi:ParB family chromosome partitioning protein|nr:ParB/RepB/Spo0J family partition protein [Bacillota bacterium]NLN52257.1 ParB/RepB/Spo0J family partition protein [Clostridiaceae bacterium]
MTAKNKKQTGLGRGLGALLGQTEKQFQQNSQTTEKILEIDLEQISPNRNQPRQDFDQLKLEELAQSIKQHGVLQPIIVTQKENTDHYSIIAGERRWRAAKLAKLKTIPVIVRELDDHLILQHSIIENIQRENLNPVEEAQAYRELMDQYNMTQEELANNLGKSRPAVANTLRLNNLPEEILKELAIGSITAGHARSLLALGNIDDQINLCESIINQDLSVRQTEKHVAKLNDPPVKTKKREKIDQQYELSIKNVETNLSKSLGTKVKLKDRAGKGQIIIPYNNNEELSRLIEILSDQI